MTRARQDLVTPEVVQKIRSENRLLLERTQSIQASIETGRFDEAAPIAAELDRALRKHVLLIDLLLRWHALRLLFFPADIYTQAILSVR